MFISVSLFKRHWFICILALTKAMRSTLPEWLSTRPGVYGVPLPVVATSSKDSGDILYFNGPD